MERGRGGGKRQKEEWGKMGCQELTMSCVVETRRKGGTVEGMDRRGRGG
jgi:hypothetical protein